NETSLAGGQVSIDGGADVVVSAETLLCLDNLEGGTSEVRATAPDGYGMTTSRRLQIKIMPQRTQLITFGAAEGFTAASPPDALETESISVNLPEGYQTDIVVASDTSDEEFFDTVFEYSGFIVLSVALLVFVSG